MEQKENPETGPHLNQNRIYNRYGISDQRGYSCRKKSHIKTKPR